MNKKVIIGLSGGVDSSVSAYLLKEMGYNVTALFMKNWEEDDHCSAEQDYSDVVKICDHLQIPFYTINFVKEYKEKVFADFLEGYQKGWTPNPDILCNREIKFSLFLDKATKELGASYLATGHYCQKSSDLSNPQLLRGKDKQKDQSYFLYTITKEKLQKVLFPIGHLEKVQVREIAKKVRIPTYNKKDSTGICFIGKRHFPTFLSQFIGYQEGSLVDLEGKEMGKHSGTAYYTIGQRKGIKLGGNGAAWYVVDKDAKTNTVTVVQGEDHPALFSTRLIAQEVSWISGNCPSDAFHCSAKIRYRHEDQPCKVKKLENGRYLISFASAQRAVTTGQSIVFYDGLICLGGGIIAEKIMD